MRINNLWAESPLPAAGWLQYVQASQPVATTTTTNPARTELKRLSLTSSQ